MVFKDEDLVAKKDLNTRMNWTQCFCLLTLSQMEG